MQIKKLLYWSLILCVNSFIVNAQTRECGTDAYWQKIKKRDHTKGLNLNTKSLRTSTGIATIPVVVHVLYNTAAQNVSNDQIASQIEALNRDFRKQNADASKVPATFSGLAVDCEIQFCLAQRDPEGFPTSGITRTATSKTSFSNGVDDAKFDNQGGKNAWDTELYLNLWVVPSIKSNAGLVLGYSSFPGDEKSIDGVVISYKYFGTLGTLPASNNLGRTATHEVGHWFGLYHTHQDECAGTNANTCNTAGDLVCDTPPQKQTYGCPTTQNTCTETEDKVDMTMNYMGYSDDNCMYMFSSGQKDRMWYHLNTYRSSILSSLGCQTPVIANNNVSLVKMDADRIDLCTNQHKPSVKLVNIGQNVITSVSLQYGTLSSSSNFTWQGSLAVGASEVITLNPITLSTGNQEVYIKVVTVNGQTDTDPSLDHIKSQVNVLPVFDLPFNETFEQEAPFIQNWTIKDFGGKAKWKRTDLAAVSGTYAAFIDNGDGDTGEKDELSSPLLHLQKEAKLSFKYAYKLWTEETTDENYSDTLKIFLELDCSGIPQKIFEGAGKNFTTGTPYFTEDRFIPKADEWRDISIDLSAYEDKIGRIIFRNISDIENCLFLDDINLTDKILSIDDSELSEKIKVYPTVSEGKVNVYFAGNYNIAIYNSSGILMDEKPNNVNDVHVDISKFMDHFLIFKIMTDEGSQSFKVFKKH